MNTRRLGKTEFRVSEIGFGAWAIGGRWGAVDDDESLAALHAAVDAGVTFIDTADVYGDGRSERLIGRLLTRAGARSSSSPPSSGRRAPLDVARLHVRRSSAAGSSAHARTSASRPSISFSSTALPWETYYTPAVFDSCDALVDERLVRSYGVSVERVEEALKALEYPGVGTVQIIFNIFRPAARRALLPAGAGARRRRDRARAARLRPPDGEARRATRRSPPTTTAASTATARRSTSARRSPASISRSGSTPSRSSVRSCPRTRRSRSSLSAGSSTSTRFRRTIPGAKTPAQARANAAAADPATAAVGDARAISGVYRQPYRAAGAPPLVAGPGAARLPLVKSIETCYIRMLIW